MEDNKTDEANAVRQSAEAVLAAHVSNSEGVAALYQGACILNDCLKPLDFVTTSLKVIKENLDSVKEEIAKVIDKDEKLETMVHALENEVTGLTEIQGKLATIKPALEDMEVKMKELSDKAAKVDEMLKRLKTIEEDLAGRQPVSPKLSTRGRAKGRGGVRGQRKK